VAGAILLCPYLDGTARAITNLRTNPQNVAWLLGHALKHVVGGRDRVPVTAQPGGRAGMTLPGEADGFASMIAIDSPRR
jgi:hypothetical protein